MKNIVGEHEVNLDSQLSRFYAMPVTTDIATFREERLTDPETKDLVEAHLKINFGYFGAIDKTLSGFVILDDEGDNYTLLDLRDSGQVFWQDHETRELYIDFDSFQDYVSYKHELADAAEDADKSEIKKRYRPQAFKGKKTLPTPQLAERYQWLVWLLAQPLRNSAGALTQTTEELVQEGLGRFKSIWPRPDIVQKAVSDELPLLADDPHLAIYWILHFAMMDDRESLDKVIEAVKANSSGLLKAFVTVFGNLAPQDDLHFIPDFRKRRALNLFWSCGTDEERMRCALHSYAMAPPSDELLISEWVMKALDAGIISDEQVTSILSPMTENTLSTEVVRTVLDKRAGKFSSSHADSAVRLINAYDGSWVNIFYSLWEIHELVEDYSTFKAVIEKIRPNDPFHARFLKMMIHLQKKAGRQIFATDAALRAELELAEKIKPILDEILLGPADLLSIIGKVKDSDVRIGVAYRILARVALDRTPSGVIVWAMEQVLNNGSDDAPSVVAKALGDIPLAERREVLKAISTLINSVEHPVVDVLIKTLTDLPDVGKEDFSAALIIKELREQALKILFPYAHEPKTFDALMDMVNSNGPDTSVAALWNYLFSNSEAETFLLPKLTNEQAIRVAKTMVASQLAQPDSSGGSAAGYQLSRFEHRGAESYLIKALDEYADAYAADKANKSPALEGVVAKLYSALRSMKTPKTITALIERLFLERRSHWRLANAIKDIWSEDTHHEIMKRIRSRHEPMAVINYMFTLEHHLKKNAPVVELLKEFVDWPIPPDSSERIMYKYVLLAGIKAALELKEFHLVRKAHALAQGISEVANEPDQIQRGETWENPFETDELWIGQLKTALSGQAEKARDSAMKKAERQKKSGKPRRTISNDELGTLAGVTVDYRLFEDRETGEIWFWDADARFHYFDGYAVGSPSFTPMDIGVGKMQTFLEGVKTISERAMFWNKRRTEWIDIVRYENRVTLFWGVNNGELKGQGLRFASESEAAKAFQRLKVNLMKGFEETEPWYVPGKGAVVRKYYNPDPKDGGPNWMSVVNGQIFEEAFRSDEAAIAEHQKRELAIQQNRNAHLAKIEWQKDLKRLDELTVMEWIQMRIRDDKKDVAWHVEALTEIAGYLREHAFDTAIGKFGVNFGKGVSEAEIISFEKQCKQPLPETLRLFWKNIGSASWKVGNAGMRILTPAQMLESKPAALKAGEKILEKVTKAQADNARAFIENLYVLVETDTGEPVTFFADAKMEDSRVFANAKEKPQDFWWEKHLNWIFSVGFLIGFRDALQRAVPSITKVRYGIKYRGDRT